MVRHFLACCSQNAEGQETSVEVEVAGEGFSAQGLAITARNYLDVFPYDKWSDKVCLTTRYMGHCSTYYHTSLYYYYIFYVHICGLS